LADNAEILILELNFSKGPAYKISSLPQKLKDATDRQTDRQRDRLSISVRLSFLTPREGCEGGGGSIEKRLL